MDEEFERKYQRYYDWAVRVVAFGGVVGLCLWLAILYAV